MRSVRLPLFPLLVLFAACEEGPDVSRAPWELVFFPNPLDVGAVAVGSSVEATVRVDNTGTGGAEISALSIGGTAGGAFRLAENWQGELAATGSVELRVIFEPLDDGQVQDRLVIGVIERDATTALQVPLLGRGVLAAVRAYPLVLDFGPVPEGDDATRILTLENLTQAPLEIGGATFDGDTDGFTLLPPVGVTGFPWLIEAEATIQVVVEFEAEEMSEVDAELNFLGPDGEAWGVTVGLRANRCVGSSDPGWDADLDGFTPCGGDCDDQEEAARPGGLEVGDLIDNDCDGTTDEGTELYDDDGDGMSEFAGDCNDYDPEVNYGGVEEANGQDDDCDGAVDEGTSADDGDGDGYTTPAGDCDDADPTVYPGAPEAADGVDDNCDGTIDEGTPARDDDGDGYCEDPLACSGGATPGDCNDGDIDVNPGQTDVMNGIDDDCDGTVDDGTSGADDDGDGYAEAGGDCDDANPTTYPGAPELPDGQDNDCDSTTDEGTTLVDDDGDGFTEFAGDCNDSDTLVFPFAPEDLDAANPGEGDGIDNDCDGIVDEGTAAYDDDGDGVTELGGDCDDADIAISPAQWDYPGDGTDADCDGND